jgi:hypothetical protein
MLIDGVFFFDGSVLVVVALRFVDFGSVVFFFAGVGFDLGLGLGLGVGVVGGFCITALGLGFDFGFTFAFGFSAFFPFIISRVVVVSQKKTWNYRNSKRYFI